LSVGTAIGGATTSREGAAAAAAEGNGQELAAEASAGVALVALVTLWSYGVPV